MIAVLLGAVVGLAAPAAPAAGPPPLVAGILVAEGVHEGELCGPLEVLAGVRAHAAPGIQVLTIGPDPSPLRGGAGLRVTPDCDYETAPALDLLIVPGCAGHLRPEGDDPRLLDFVRDRGARARFVVGLGSGALVLARSGLLDGRSCTTFPAALAELRARHPEARALDAVSFVVDGPIVTAAGGARSHEPALWLVERLFGETPAVAVARGLALEWNVERVRHSVTGTGDSRAYRVGDRIDPAVTVEDGAGERRRLLDLLEENGRVLVLCLFGGGDAKGEVRRAGLWCEDSLNEMGLLRHARTRFAGRGVTFVPVACPPGRHEEEFGYAEGGFRPGSPDHESTRAAFVAATERAVATGIVPFDRVWYDATFRLLRDPREKPAAAGEPDWVGRFRPDGEFQTYGTPCIWVFGADGTVLVPPFHGNNYEIAERRLRYGDLELLGSIERALAAAGGG